MAEKHFHVTLSECRTNMFNIANRLNTIAQALFESGNHHLASRLTNCSQQIANEIMTLQKAHDADFSRQIQLAEESSRNVLQAALAGIKIVKKD